MNHSKKTSQGHNFQTRFPSSWSLVQQVNNDLADLVTTKEEFHQLCRDNPSVVDTFPFLPELFSVEQSIHKLQSTTPGIEIPTSEIIVNPQLELITVQYSGLANLLNDKPCVPTRKLSHICIFRTPGEKDIQVVEAHPHDLLALKIVSESLDYRQVSREAGTTLGQIDDIVYNAIQKGILISPSSRIRRPEEFKAGCVTDRSFFSSRVFTLQWHITQQCDLHCRHCYDRSKRQEMTLEQGTHVLDELYDFCLKQFVYGQVTFTGGNPLLYPDFLELYRQATDRGFLTAILGNPTSRAQLEEILHIQKPQYYQVSLEGMESHNDYIRGKNHFNRVIKFLQLLKELDIYSMVMLTLTRDNQDQVLELAEFLRDKVDRFNFNRLSMVGEGAALTSVDVDGYSNFLRNYKKAAENNPAMGLKDNFFNLLQYQDNATQFYGGCAGHGCGAAFNFVSLLPDGRVDACRKFDSPMGNIFKEDFLKIYHGKQGELYRNGPSNCNDCDIRPVCRGCMAVSFGMGKDVFKEIDPYCFMKK